MIKYFCDRCGREREKYEMFTVTINLPEIWSYYDDILTYKCGDLHFCRDCMEKIGDCIEELGRNDD